MPFIIRPANLDDIEIEIQRFNKWKDNLVSANEEITGLEKHLLCYLGFVRDLYAEKLQEDKLELHDDKQRIKDLEMGLEALQSDFDYLAEKEPSLRDMNVLHK